MGLDRLPHTVVVENYVDEMHYVPAGPLLLKGYPRRPTIPQNLVFGQPGSAAPGNQGDGASGHGRNGHTTEADNIDRRQGTVATRLGTLHMHTSPPSYIDVFPGPATPSVSLCTSSEYNLHRLPNWCCQSLPMDEYEINNPRHSDAQSC